MEDDGLLPGEDGIPLLTNNINPDDFEMDKATHDRLLNTSAPELVARLLESESLRQKLDEIAARMTVNARQDLEAAIRPAIEEAITHALNASGDNIYLAIGKQLENALPDILPHLLQAIDSGEN
jgi:hypothetical protein